ncbi:MAG: RNB domain-containing ribonuclease [Pseudanabaenaceae cyanobacterium]
MQFSVAQLLEACSEDKLVAPKALEKKLGIDSEEGATYLQIALEALEKCGLLEKERGKYRRVSEDGLLEARLRCSSKGYCFAVQEVEGGEVIYIRENKLSSAWHGDKVLVKVTKDGMRRRNPEGEVKLVLERTNGRILARLKATPQGYRAVPLDTRLNVEIELLPYPNLEDCLDRLVHIEILRYALGNLPPLARITRVLGQDDSTSQEQELVRCKYNLPNALPQNVGELINTVPKLTPNRLDWRQRRVAQLGEALISIEPERQGWEIGVHISDVATYVPLDSPLDLLARERGRAYWLGEQVIPMLPPLPMLEQPERLCISVLMHLNEGGEMVWFEIHPTLVRVTADKEPVLANLEASRPVVENYLAAVAIDIDIPWGEQGDDGILGVLISRSPLQGLVARLLMMANRAIALHCKALGLPALFYGQPEPDPDRLTDWLNLLQEWGVTPTDTRRYLSQIQQVPNPTQQNILKQLFINLLRPGEYALQPQPHYGMLLAGRDTPYCHAVLPQYRYPDLLNQHLLHLLFNEGRDRRSSRSKEGVDLRSSRCHGQISWSVLPPETERQFRNLVEGLLPTLNQQEQQAYKSALELEALRKILLLQPHVGKTLAGIITAVQKYRFFVSLEDSLAEGLVHVSSLKDDWYEFQTHPHNKRGRALVGKRSGKQYTVGDRIEVQVRAVDYYRQQVDLTIPRPAGVADTPEPEEEEYDPEEILDE